MEIKKRVEYIDALKGLCIIFTVYAHGVLIPDDSIIGNAFMTMCWGVVPSFFMASGAVLHQKKEFRWKKHIQQLVTIYLGLVFWRFIYWLAYYLAGRVQLSKFEMLNYLFLLHDVEQIDTGVMWYMAVYLSVMLVYPITWFLFKGGRQGRQILVALMILIFCAEILVPSVQWGLNNLFDTQLFNLDSIISIFKPLNNGVTILYVMLGAFWLEYRDKIEDKISGKKRLVYPVCVVCGVIGLMFIKYRDFGSWAWEGKYEMYQYVHVATLILTIGMYGVFASGLFRPIEHLLARLFGRNTLGIYYMHYIVLAVFSWSVVYQTCMEHYFVGMNMVKAVLVALLCAGVTMLMKKIPLIRKVVS